MIVANKKSLLFLMLFLTGCAATYTAVSKRNLIVQNKMNKSIFLDPVAPAKRVVFVEVRNTSDSPEFDILTEVRNSISAKGYRITENPEEAHFLLQANVLHVSYSGDEAGGGLSSAITGGVLGGAGGAVITGGTARGAVGGAILGGLASTVADAAVKDVTFNVITDILLSQRDSTAKKGSDGEWKKHKAKIMSSANQANLKLEDAVTQLKQGIAMGISGVF